MSGPGGPLSRLPEAIGRETGLLRGIKVWTGGGEWPGWPPVLAGRVHWDWGLRIAGLLTAKNTCKTPAKNAATCKMKCKNFTYIIKACPVSVFMLRRLHAS